MKTIEKFITVKQEDRWNILYIGEMAVSKFKIGSYAGTQNLERAKNLWREQLEKVVQAEVLQLAMDVKKVTPSHFHQHPDNSHSPCDC